MLIVLILKMLSMLMTQSAMASEWVSNVSDSVRDAVVQMNVLNLTKSGDSKASAGSGFVINKSQTSMTLLTAAHVLGESDGIHFILLSRDETLKNPCKIIAMDMASDIAAIQCMFDSNSHLFRPLHLSEEIPNEGDEVCTWGTPRAIDIIVSCGIVTKSSRVEKEFPHLFSARLPITGGNSGGPIIAKDGSVIGLVHGGFPSVPDWSLLIKGSEIAIFLNKHQIPFNQIDNQDLNALLSKMRSSDASYRIPPTRIEEPSCGLTKAEIEAVIRLNLGHIKGCYERNLQGNRGIPGRVVYNWKIAANGRVFNTHVTESSLYHSPTEDCISSRIRLWKFPPPSCGSEVNVTYPFSFMPRS